MLPGSAHGPPETAPAAPRVAGAVQGRSPPTAPQTWVPRAAPDVRRLMSPTALERIVLPATA
eukprot:552671-Alexandrium_andersonii.AAC.1